MRAYTVRVFSFNVKYDSDSNPLDPGVKMKLSVEVKRILDSLAEQNGDDPIDEESALLLYGGGPSTFNNLALYQRLQYAIIVVSSNRDEIGNAYTTLAKAYNELLVAHGEAKRIIGQYGNRAQRRGRGFR